MKSLVTVTLNKRKTLLTGLILVLAFTTGSAQHLFRRHFIIAYDVSPPFMRAQAQAPEMISALQQLFQNKIPAAYSDADQDNLLTERKNGLLFFDPTQDEISFYHFNVSAIEMDQLRYQSYGALETKILEDFNNAFIKDKNLRWSDYVKQPGRSIADYFNAALSQPVTPSYFGRGVSMSDFVFPLVLNKVDTAQYAEEYELIILSDFLTGSDLGNKNDIDRVRDIYRMPYGIALSTRSPVNIIKRQIDQLSAGFYKIDYFQYVFQPYVQSKSIAIIAYKIKPKAGNLNPEDLSLFIDGDLRLYQKGYRSTYFDVSATSIKFTHNRALIPDRLRLEILADGSSRRKLFEGVVAKRNQDGHWVSRFTDDDRLLDFDSLKTSYFLPKLHLALDSNINHRDFETIKVIYNFDCHYQTGKSPPLNLIYKAERNIPLDQIDFSTKITLIMIYVIIPIILLLSLTWYLFKKGKPLGVFLKIEPFVDSFEKTDYANAGRLHTSYCPWSGEFESDKIPVNGRIGFSSAGYLFNWKPAIKVTLMNYTIADGFELFLMANNQSAQEYGAGIPMAIQRNRKNELLFWIGLRQNSVTRILKEPFISNLHISLDWNETRMGISSNEHLDVRYNFSIGPDLGDVWVAFDPGTSGSCCAIGSSTENILLATDIYNNAIVDSKLVFEIEENLETQEDLIPDKLIKHGAAAKVRFGTPRVMSFQSIKKLLGYTNLSKITFKNGRSVELSGKALATLLVKGLFTDLKTTILKPTTRKDEYFRNGVFDPKRAVVAIPNNFTLTKIQDMVDCVYQTGQFSEIRFIYEAEAVLFYYLSNSSRLNDGAILPDEENVLVFDMGGATINASVMNCRKVIEEKQTAYEISYLSKIGYGIGGDTIDYCIIGLLKEHAFEYPELATLADQTNTKALSELALSIKREIIENYGTRSKVLIYAVNLENLIKEHLKILISIDEETSALYSYFKREGASQFSLFDHHLFKEIIFESVNDAVSEAIALAGQNNIQKIIFSGRSTAFPLIKTVVNVAVAKSGAKPKSIQLGLDESKIAVAIGACWYGINKGAVRLNNLKTNASFGIKKTRSAAKEDIHYYELVKAGTPFDNNNSVAKDSVEIMDNFAFDGGKVNFFQVMGKDAASILAKDQRHKYSRIAYIQLTQLPKTAAIEVYENDDVKCFVEFKSGNTLYVSGIVSDQDINDANDEHYTWILK